MSKMNNRTVLNKPLFIAFAAFTIIGIVCWIVQLTQGLQLTNLNNYNTWGLYIIGFMLFTGVAAGSLIFASSAWLFQSLKEYRPYTRISAFVGAIGSVVAAGLFIIVDIGNPERVWNIIVNANFSSPMFWDTLVLSAYIIIGIIFTRQLILVEEGKKEEKSLRAISLIAFIAGLMVTVTSFVFALQVARPLWNNAVQPLSFLIAALVAALALLTIIFIALRKNGYIEINNELQTKLCKITAAFLLAELLVVLGETIVGLYPGGGEHYTIIQWLVTGEGAPFFWVELAAIVAGIVLLFGKKTGVQITGASIAIFAIFMIKYNLIQAQLINPLISYAGPPGYNGGEGVYLPSLLEIGLSLGIIALGGLLVMIGLYKLSMGTRKTISKNNIKNPAS